MGLGYVKSSDPTLLFKPATCPRGLESPLFTKISMSVFIFAGVAVLGAIGLVMTVFDIGDDNVTTQ